MSAYKTDAIIRDKGELHLSALPFEKGDRVEVTLVRRKSEKVETGCRPLRGQPLRYERPLDSVAEEDWDAQS